MKISCTVLYCTVHELQVSEQHCKILGEQLYNKCELRCTVRDKAVPRKIILFVTVLLKD